ncbi:MAG: hypothetical protein AAFP79_15405, partial [Pseudomonadota bacterium]
MFDFAPRGKRCGIGASITTQITPYAGKNGHFSHSLGVLIDLSKTVFQNFDTPDWLSELKVNEFFDLIRLLDAEAS